VKKIMIPKKMRMKMTIPRMKKNNEQSKKGKKPTGKKTATKKTAAKKQLRKRKKMKTITRNRV